MRISKLVIFAVVASLAAVASASADVQLSISNGRVTLIAKDATVRQILTEWARVGQTRVVNMERVPNGLVTLEFRNVPEQQALDTLLRSVSGYVAAPRAEMVANASVFDRIVVMPASAPPPATATRQPANPAFQQQPPPGMFVPSGMQTPQVADDDDDETPAPPVNRGPVFNAYPAPQVTNPQQMLQQTPGVAPQVPIILPQQQEGAPNMPAYQPAIPFGGSVPGMVLPQQPGPGGVNQPNQPAQPKRPGPGEPDRQP